MGAVPIRVNSIRTNCMAPGPAGLAAAKAVSPQSGAQYNPAPCSRSRGIRRVFGKLLG